MKRTYDSERPDLDAESIPVLRPHLPTAQRLLPYLQRIDQARIYSNFGPLVAELEKRLAEQLSLPAGGIVLAGSGSSALVGAILGLAGRAMPDKPFAIIPAFTFVGTAAAVEMCGYMPYLSDVAPDSWTLDPEQLKSHPDLDRVGLVVPVSTFGCGVNVAQWEEFSQLTGIPVVIDAAAAFDRIICNPRTYIGQIPVAVSFHATKSFATGEGGCVLSTDSDLIARTAAALNFGFSGSRDARSSSINGKMSEYHAAVGLAELDSWQQKLAAMNRVVSSYIQSFRDAGLVGRLYSSPSIGASYVLFLCKDDEEANRVCREFRKNRIDYRFWYGSGIQNQTHYRNSPNQGLKVTESIATRLIGLPFAPDLSLRAILRVTKALSAAVGAGDCRELSRAPAYRQVRP